MMPDTTELYILILVYMARTLIYGHRCMSKQKTSLSIFLQMSPSIWMKISMLSQYVDVLEFMISLFYMINIQEK